MIAEAPQTTGDGTLLMLFMGTNRGFFNNELPAASVLLALARTRQTLEKAKGVLNLLVGELN